MNAILILSIISMVGGRTPDPPAAGAAIAQAAPQARATAPSPAAVPPDSAIQKEAREIAAGLRCPVCRGQSIQDSEASLAGEMRALIRDKLRSGESPQEIRDYFRSKYGEWILLQPEPHGLNLAVYVLPVLALLGGGVLVLQAARRWTRHPTPAGDEAEDPESASFSGRA